MTLNKKLNGKQISIKYIPSGQIITGIYYHRNNTSSFDFQYEYDGKILNGVFNRSDFIVISTN